jgi:hypothetical protein
MQRKTVWSALSSAILAAAAVAVLSTSARAQSPGEGPEIVVPSETFEAVTAWLGDLEENPTFKEFLAENEGGRHPQEMVRHGADAARIRHSPAVPS